MTINFTHLSGAVDPQQVSLRAVSELIQVLVFVAARLTIKVGVFGLHCAKALLLIIAELKNKNSIKNAGFIVKIKLV